MEKTKLYILWTNQDIITSEKMVIMYATNSMLKKWWDSVTVIIWGATAKLVAENKNVQAEIKTAQEAGVYFSACKACAEQLNVMEEITNLGIDVHYWGEDLTSILKNNEKLITI